LTGDLRFLQTAENSAQFYLAMTPSDGVPPWDYDAPDTGPLSRRQPDSSARPSPPAGYSTSPCSRVIPATPPSTATMP